MTPMRPVIAIDGAAGSGKSTLARALAAELGLPYVNTGLMYRAVALKADRSGVAPDDGDALAGLARGTRFELDSSVRPPELTIDGEPPSADLSSPEVESSVSAVARHPQVRAVLREEQRRLAFGGAVMEGRDIGTVVAPDATLKLFLQAHPLERAERRAIEREDDRSRTAEALGTRDELDARTNPLVPASDAVVLDTTETEPEAVLGRALALARERGIGT
jgi:CMP/dCMP kinase